MCIRDSCPSDPEIDLRYWGGESPGSTQAADCEKGTICSEAADREEGTIRAKSSGCASRSCW